MKFDIGAGRPGRDGWTTIDANPRTRADIVATLPPIPDVVEGAEAVRMIHVLEHFYIWEAREILRDLFRLIAPGGRLILELPNLRSAIETLSGANGRPVDQWGMWVLYGNPGGRNPLYGHKWGWTPETLSAELIAAGFAAESIQAERARHHVPARDFRLVVTK